MVEILLKSNSLTPLVPCFNYRTLDKAHAAHSNCEGRWFSFIVALYMNLNISKELPVILHTNSAA